MNTATYYLPLIPGLNDDNQPMMAWPIAGVTVLSVLSVLFVLAGASARLGGFPFFQP